MDVVNLITHIQGKFGSLFKSKWGTDNATISGEVYEPLYLCVVAFVGLFLATVVFLARKWHRKLLMEKESLLQVSTTRFRKRDKALFYGRKMLRKVRSISGQVRNSGQGRKRKMVMRFARRLLQLKKETDTEQLKVVEPPAEYLQETTRMGDDRMPADVLYILQSIRVFGHFEKPIFLKLCKHTEIINIEAGTYLFKIGEPDENVFVVQSGKLNVYITNPDGTVLSLKVVKPGESVTSLLSFTDILSGHAHPYRTVSAKAIETSTIIKLPMIAFQEVFQDNPDVFIRVIQVIMVRLQRVTFTALHEYLGLSAELVNPGPKSKRNSFAFASPSKKVKKEEYQDNTSDTSSHSLHSGTASTPVPVPQMSAPSAPTLSQKRAKNVDNTKSLQFKTAPTYSSFSVAPDMIPDNDVGNLKIDPSSILRYNYSHEEFSGRRRTNIPADNADEASLLAIAYEAFAKVMCLDDVSILHGKVELRELSVGTFLAKEHSNTEVALVYVISGSLTVSQAVTDGDEEVHMFTAHPGEFLGGLAILTGEPSFFTSRAKHFTRIAMISNTKFYKLMKDKPNIVLHVANIVVRKLSAFVRQVDFALDWVFLEAGRAVYRQDDESDSTFVVLSGRLRSVITHKSGKKELVGEYGKGDLIGIVEMVTQTRRSTTVIAVRDSELAKLPEGLFNTIKLRFPIVVTRLIKLLGRRILGSWQTPTVGLSLPLSTKNAAVDSRPSQLNFSTVAIVPVSDDVPLTAFTYELYHCLSSLGLTLRLTSEVVKKTLGLAIMDPNNEYRLTSWLAQQEDHHKISLYQCDTSFTAWTQRCIRQADCILIVGLGGSQPTLGKVEKEIERVAMRTQKELVLLHREINGKPKNTVAWLNMRTWISSHHHILCPKRMFSRKSLYRINELYSKVCTSEPNIHSDFSRLARWLSGKSVGLVLGGGGARGAAHVGMIKSIIEAGIPIDMVGGVSIGAFMGALWCKERNITTVTQMAREWAKKMTQWWRQILDLTYPMTSMFSGRDFNQTIHGTFGDTYIEDLWLPYFTVTTDISASCMRIHQYGSLWRYVRSSMSLSGYMPPLCDPTDGHLLLDGGYTNNLPGQAWRYIRASMSIVGIFPPLCDPVDGHLLADGCYVNNVPADVMRGLGANHIIAIDVGSVDDSDLTNYGDDLSGWWLLWKRWNPFTDSVKVPNLPDIQSRLAYVSCVRQLEEVKTSDYCEYIRPPIDCYRTLQFGSFDEIRDVGFRHGKAYFEEKLKAGTLPVFRHEESSKSVHQQHSLLGYTFTDLAQMVCQVQRPYEDDSNSDLSSDEDNRGYASEPSVGISEPTAKQYGRPYGSQSFSETEMDSDAYDELTKRDTNKT